MQECLAAINSSCPEGIAPIATLIEVKDFPGRWGHPSSKAVAESLRLGGHIEMDRWGLLNWYAVATMCSLIVYDSDVHIDTRSFVDHAGLHSHS